MKLVPAILLLALIFILPLESKKASTSLKSKTKHKISKSSKSQDIPRTLAALSQQLFPQKIMEQDKSPIEEDPGSYSLMNPLNETQNDFLTPHSVYGKDPKEFGLTPANLSDIRPDQIYLVKNLTFLRTVPGFEDPNDAFQPHESTPSLYHGDKAAYYNPVGDFRNIYRKRREGLYSVPIEMFANGSRVYEENKEKQNLKNRLKRDPSTYYDPNYVPFIDILDPLNKTLIRAAKRHLSPPSQQYDEYLNDQARSKYHIDLLLGKKEVLPVTYGKDRALEQALEKEKVHREAQMVAEEVKTDFHLNRKRKEPYYDPSLKRFKEINKKTKKQAKSMRK